MSLSSSSQSKSAKRAAVAANTRKAAANARSAADAAKKKQEACAKRDRRQAAVLKMMQNGMPDDMLLNIEPEVTTLLKVSKATVYRLLRNDPTFPKLRKFTDRCSRLRWGDLREWQKTKAGA